MILSYTFPICYISNKFITISKLFGTGWEDNIKNFKTKKQILAGLISIPCECLNIPKRWPV